MAHALSSSALTLILAGGEGKRLRPLTSVRCKPAVAFGADFRVIDFTLLNCLSSGIREVFLLTQYEEESLRAWISDRWQKRRCGLSVECLSPAQGGGRSLYRGTADAVYQNEALFDRLRPEVVLILSGDHVYRADYERFIAAHLESGADLSILSGEVAAHEAQDLGVLVGGGADRSSEREIRGFVEKPSDPSPYARSGACQVNLGVYCFRAGFLRALLRADAALESTHDFGRDLIPRALSLGKVHAVPLGEVCPGARPYWRDIGSLQSFYSAHMDLLGEEPRFELRYPSAIFDHAFRWAQRHLLQTALRPSGSGQCLISPLADVRTGDICRSVVSAQARVGRGAHLEGCIVLPGADVGEDVRLRGVIVDEDVVIPRGVCIESDAIDIACARPDWGTRRRARALAPLGAA